MNLKLSHGKFLEQMLAFVGDAEKFKKFKEKFCNGRRKYLASKRKRSQKENKAPTNAPAAKKAKNK